MFRPLSLVLFAALALALAACDGAGTDTAPDGGSATDAPLGDASASAGEVFSPERALAGDVLRRTLLSDLPLDEALVQAGAAFAGRARGAVFTLTDAAGPNEVLVFARDREGALTPFGTYPTGGTGSGGGLGAATNPVVLSPDGRYLYVVNRGSDNLSVFRVSGSGLTLVEAVSSGGSAPLSLAVSERLVYVLNTGRDGIPGSVVSFERGRNGRLRALANGAVGLPEGVAGPPQIGFDPTGRTLVVTDRPSNVIVAYPVRIDGTPGAPRVTASAGVTPFGFDFDTRGRVFVSDANAPNGPVPDGSTVSAYRLGGTRLNVIDAAVPTTETAACWLRVLGDYLYVTNTASGTISGFQIAPGGTLTLLDDDGITATTGANPRDLSIALRFVYAQSDGRLDAYRIREDGSLAVVNTVSVPATARGVASR